MKKWARRLLALLLLSCLLACAAVLWVLRLAETRLPALDGEIRHESLKGPVRVLRDEWGVPHILAENEEDAYFALGHAVAQERLFQLELLRRLSSGELAELLGPPLVRLDKIARSFRLRRKAEETAAILSAEHPRLAALMGAYCAGINHFQETGPPPFEFTVLQIPVRPFTPVDCLTAAAILPITLADALRVDSLHALIEARCPGKPVSELFPNHDLHPNHTIIEGGVPPEGVPAAAKNTAAAPQPMAALAAWNEALFEVTRKLSPALGSNSWVLNGGRTVSGKALLANDPHIGFTNPSVWYEAHLVYGDVNHYGHYFPLIPLALTAHTEKIAWGLTMFSNDDVDFYRETFDPNNPDRVMHQGEYTDVKRETARIKVRFGRDVDAEIRVTPHGPVVTDLFRILNGHNGPDISMSWVWQQVPYTDLIALHRMNTARTYDEFAAAMPLITSPGLNVSYADADGNIAWWAAGKIVLRPGHVNGKTLLDGASGKDEITGYAPFGDNPHLKNPPRGHIVTANNLPTMNLYGGKLLDGYWQPSDRAVRITDRLESAPKWDAESAMALQNDDYAATADAMLGVILPAVKARQDGRTPLESGAASLLESWDRRHGISSAGALVFHYLCDRITVEALQDELGPELLNNYFDTADQWICLKSLLQNPDSPFWDRTGTPEVETRDTVIADAFSGAVAELRRDHGDAPGQWQWGRAHTVTYSHPFGYLPGAGRLFNIGPLPSPGAYHTINNMVHMGGRGNYGVIAGPSTRRVVDFSTSPPQAWMVLPTGNSGQLKSPHYDDQARMFLEGRNRRVHFLREDVEKSKRHELRLLPAAK